MEDEFRISYKANGRILEVVLEGVATDDNAKEIQRRILEIINAHSHKFRLIDLRALKGRTSTVFTYYQVMDFPTDNIPTRAAIIDLPENKDFYTFHETAAVNRGFPWRYFNDADEARAWLLK